MNEGMGFWWWFCISAGVIGIAIDLIRRRSLSKEARQKLDDIPDNEQW